MLNYTPFGWYLRTSDESYYSDDRASFAVVNSQEENVGYLASAFERTEQNSARLEFGSYPKVGEETYWTFMG